MAEARGNFFWQQTSVIEALMININRAKNSKAVSPNELNPYAPKQKKKDSFKITGKAAWDMLKMIVENLKF